MRRNRRNTIHVKKLFSIVLLVLLFISLSVNHIVMAENNKKEQTYKYYTSVQIQSGDTLWSIASKYCVECDISVENYVKELCSINNLTSSDITSGQYLTIFYYSNELK